MTKICGIVMAEGRGEAGEILRRMYEALWEAFYLRKEMWNSGGVGLGHFGLGAVNPEAQPVFCPGKQEAMVYCGKMFDYSRIKTELRKAGAEFQQEENDAEFMLNLIGQTGVEKLKEINGIYSLAHWNQESKRLTLINDRYGLRPVYYWHDPSRGMLAFSSDLRGVMASGLVPRRINWRAANVFLHFGHHLGEDTFFEDVSLLPPGAVLRFEKNVVKIERYWDIAKIPIQENMEYSEAVSGCAELFSQAMRRRNIPTKGKKVVFLSGGLDSGRIAAELKKQGGAFTTYTARGFKREAPDVSQAQAVAGALGVENHFVNLPTRDFLLNYFSRTARLADYETPLHAWILPLVEQLPLECTINYDGIAGDIPFNGVRRASEFTDKNSFLEAMKMPAGELAEKLVSQRQGYSILTGGLRRKLDGSDVIESVQQELTKYAGTPNQLTCWYMMNRTRRAIAVSPLKLIARKAESFLPYYDNDLFAFVMGIPPLMKIEHSFRKDMVRLAYPELAGVYDSGVKQEDGGGYDIDYSRQRKQFFWRNVKRHYLGNHRMFDTVHSFPRLLKDMIQMRMNPDHISYLFNVSFLVFYEFLETYFVEWGRDWEEPS